MGHIDTWTTEYLRNREVFADLVNAALFHGKQRVRPTDLIEADTVYKEEVYVIEKNKIRKDFAENKMINTNYVISILKLLKEKEGCKSEKLIIFYNYMIQHLV